MSGEISIGFKLFGLAFKKRLYSWKGFREGLNPRCYQTDKTVFNTCDNDDPSDKSVQPLKEDWMFRLLPAKAENPFCYPCYIVEDTVNDEVVCAVMPERFNHLSGSTNINLFMTETVKTEILKKLAV